MCICITIWNTGGLWHQGKSRSARMVFKEKVNVHSLYRSYEMIYLQNVNLYIWNYCWFSISSSLTLVSFSFIPFFTKHVVLLTLFFPSFHVESCPLILGVVICLASRLLGGFLCSILSIGHRFLRCYISF